MKLLKIYNNILKESQYSISDFKRGQIIKINPNAEVSYTYKKGFVSSKILKNNNWYIDDIDKEEGIINIHSLDPISGEGEIGGVCSNVFYKDVTEIIRK